MASSVDAKLLRQTKFPAEFNQKVDMKKVNVEVMKKWIASKISEILGNEDDVVIELCFNLLEGSRFPDIKSLQISLTGFLDKDTPKFCKELWNLCLSAQSNPQGVPKELLEAKKLELLQEKIDAEKIAEETRRRKEQESTRNREVDTIRQRERAERGQGRSGGRRGNPPFDSRRSRVSRSPPRRRRASPERGLRPRRDVDTYIPRGGVNRRSGQRDRSRTRSSSRSTSRSSSLDRRHHRRRLHSRSRSPQRLPRSRRPRSPSSSPLRRGGGRSRRRSVSRVGRSHPASYSSRSPSPRRRWRSSRSSKSPSLNLSPSPPPKHQKMRRRTSSSSRSRSISKDRDGRKIDRRRRSRRSPTSDSQDDRRVSRADVVKDRNTCDDRRLSRSGDRESRRRHSSQSRSRSRSVLRERKRRRSLERWAPSARRRRNTSSVTSPDGKRRKVAAASVDRDFSERPLSRDHAGDGMAKEDDKEFLRTPSQTTVPVPPRSMSKLTANEIREKLLREKIKASRKASMNGKAD